MFEKLVHWSLDHYSHLPWREKRSEYHTLVSEIMLQQTTVSTVLNHFERFIKQYPNIETLAKASEEEILIAWKGLGYYRRARNLLKAAKDIQASFSGQIPKTYDELVSINGIGPYTANAIIAMGRNERALCVDANLERVLARLYRIEEVKGPKLQKLIYQKFVQEEISPEIKEFGARVYNEALMDLGRSLCQARKVSCEICPLSEMCQSRTHAPLNYPVEIKKEKTQMFELHLLRVIIQDQGKTLGYIKGENEWLSSQVEIPTYILYSEDETLKQYPKLKAQDHYFLLPTIKSAITKYKITNYVLFANKEDLDFKLDRKFSYFNDKKLGTTSLKCLNL